MAIKGIQYTPDGRIRCQGVTWNKTKRRFEFDLWVPRDVLPQVLAAGGKEKKRTVFPQKISEDEAHAAAAKIFLQKQAEWNELRHAANPEHLAAKLMPTVTPKTRGEAFMEYANAMLRVTMEGMAPGAFWSRDHATAPRMVPPHVADAVQAIIGQWFDKHDGHLENRDAALAELADMLAAPVDNFAGVREQLMAVASKVPAQQGKDGKRFFDWHDIIPVWEIKRKKEGILTDDDARKAAIRPLNRLFTFLGHDNMNAVLKEDIDRYDEEVLLADDSGLGTGGRRDHAKYLRSLFTLAHEKDKIDQNPTIGRLEYTKDTKIGDPLTWEQYCKVMHAARQHDDPYIRLPVLVMGLTGARPDEFCAAAVADFFWEEGELRFNIRTDERRDAATLKTDSAERFLTIHSEIRDEVWAQVQARRAAGKDMMFDLPAYGTRYITNKIGKWLRSKKLGLTLGARQRFYSMRHNITTQFSKMAELGFITEALAEFLTHPPSNVRRRVYIHRDVHEISRAVEALDHPFKAGRRWGGKPNTAAQSEAEADAA